MQPPGAYPLPEALGSSEYGAYVAAAYLTAAIILGGMWFFSRRAYLQAQKRLERAKQESRAQEGGAR